MIPVMASSSSPAGATVTAYQLLVMESADDEDHELQNTDQRVVRGLIRRGWVEAVPKKVGRRKRVTVYRLTDLGCQVLATGPTVVSPPAPPNWLESWTREKLGTDHWLVEGHELHRPSRSMLWRLRCPERREPVRHTDTLPELVETLYEHLGGILGLGLNPQRPHCHPEPVDLDRLGDTGRASDGASKFDARPSLFDAFGVDVV